MKVFAKILALCISLFVNSTMSFAQNPASIEYFFDQDPGYGNGISLNYTTATGTTMNFQPDISNLADGIHLFCVRAKDGTGNWSVTHTRVFVKKNTTSNSNIVEIEYFIDNDPGFGNAQSLVYNQNGSGIMLFDIDVNSLEDGIHLLYIRAKDSLGNWSVTHSKGFIKQNISSNGTISEIEYFIDNDPGYGNGQSLVYNQNGSGKMLFDINVNSLQDGIHLLYIRAKDNSGNWSITHSRGFVKQNISANSTISEIEYFIDNDPGYGNGQSLVYNQNGSGNMLFEINVNSLQDGIHLLYIRAKDNSSNWSVSHVKPFFKSSPIFNNATITEIEYFIGEDPGIGNGKDINFSPNPNLKTVIANFDIAPSELSAGENIISVRAKNSEGEWGPTRKYIESYFPDIGISKLAELDYPSRIEELQQSTIHRYYQLGVLQSGNFVEGLKLKYYLTSNPNTLFSSSISDEFGIIDLGIKIGGNDTSSPLDDLIPPGVEDEVKFEGIYLNEERLPLLFNQFETFNVKSLISLKPDEIEYGVNPEIKAGLSLDLGLKKKVNGVEIASVGVGNLKVGGAISPTFKITKSEFDKDDFTAFYELKAGSNAAAKFNPFFKEKGSEFSLEKLTGVKLEAKVNGNLRVNAKSNGNLRSKQNLLSLAFDFLNVYVSGNVHLFLAKNFFGRLANETLPDISVGVGLNVGGSLDGGYSADISSSIVSQIAGTEMPIELNLSTDYEKKVSLGNSLEYDIKNNRLKIGASIKAEKDAGINSEIVFNSSVGGAIKIPTARIVNNSDEYNFKMEKVIQNLKPIEVTGEFSSTKEVIINSVQNYVEYKNEFKIGKTLTNQIISDYRKNGIFYSGNAFGDFLLTGDIPLTTVFSLYPNSSNFFSHYENFISKAANVQDEAFVSGSFIGVKDLSHQKTRELIRKNNFTLGVSIPLNIIDKEKIDIGIDFDSWASHKFPLQSYLYSPSAHRFLILKDLPDNEHHLESPDYDPISQFWELVKNEISNISPIKLLEAYDFVTVFKNTVSTSLARIFSNKNAVQKNLNADIINSPKEGKSVTNNPSYISFEIPQAPQSFDNNTEIKFSYYYPENNLSAIVGEDTFQIISDAFYLNAVKENEYLNFAPNGNFKIIAEPSDFDLERASLPLSSEIELLFLPYGSDVWQVLISEDGILYFNQLGTFAYGVKISNDSISPEIIINKPSQSERYFNVQIIENQSGINWSETLVMVNNNLYNYSKEIGINSFNIYLDTLAFTDTSSLIISIYTRDFANNSVDTTIVYPCYKQLNLINFSSEQNQFYQSRRNVEIGNLVPEGKDIIINSQGDILLSPGFEVKNGKSFKAEIKGCSEP